METKFRCNCPFTSALDILGDKWMLVIVKQMLIENKQTFKDFTESDEKIATNILTTKLKQLEEVGIVIKTKLPNNKKSNIYLLTEKGLAMTPIIIELGIWSDNHLRDLNPTIVNGKGMELLRTDKAEFAKGIEQQYRKKLATIPVIVAKGSIRE
ncbi:MAG: helix-turn-helix domain-containing protein [Algibacter sp.]|uniref:winged helix-turn-helix transcriptional regulator n=1 Tax=Algibacter sp. TaxID=1872428 RepID=UPI00261E55E3|nr:helix-turn-helix domain-containing protein [Algibacter sp.]MDG1729847.1 helix-turn-helix domain-containing protein [Algibacter sp.]MDG2178703.1 helix-turn-helix domain-containing protein [Algibacter sp.]